MRNLPIPPAVHDFINQFDSVEQQQQLMQMNDGLSLTQKGLSLTQKKSFRQIAAWVNKNL